MLPPRRSAAASKAAAAADKQRRNARAPVLQNKAGRKPGKIIRTPKPSDADDDSMLDEFRFSDTPPPPQPAKTIAPRKKQNHTVTHQHQQQQQQRRQPPPLKPRDDDNDSDSSRFSGGSNDDDDEKDQKNYSGKQAANIPRANTRNSNNRRRKDDVPPTSSDIIHVDDDDEDDNDDASECRNHNNIGNRVFDGVPIDGFINPNSKEFIDNLNWSLGNGCHNRDNGDDVIEDDAKNYAASRKGTAAAAAAGKRNFRGNQHKPPSMAQSLSPHKQGPQRIPRKARFDTLDSRISQFAVDDPLDKALHLQNCNRATSAAAYYNDHSNNHYETTVNNNRKEGSLENGYQHRSNNYSRVGKNYSSQSRGTTTKNNSMAGVKFGVGSMDTKRAQHTNTATHRSETQLQQQQHHHQKPIGSATSGFKRILETAVDVVTSPFKKKWRSSSSPEEDVDVKSEDPNSDVAVYSVESHPNNNDDDDNDDDGYVDILNACGQPLRTEDIRGMTPKYTPPSNESVEDLENSQPSSEASSLWDFGVKRLPNDCKSGK